MTRWVTAAIVFWSVLGAGCASQHRFRYVQSQPGCFADQQDPIPGEPGEKRPWASLDCRHTLYSVGYVELDGDGRLVDRAQADKALRLIDERKKSAPGGKIITVVYVHGWKNNASEAMPGAKPKDVEKFQSALVDLGYRARVAAPAQPVPVVGIYIGWRGKTLMGPSWFTFLSYWGRRNTANRVGDGPDLAPLLNEVIEAAHKGGTDTRVVFVGHSFGARVLEHAVENGDVALYKGDPAAGPVDPRVDLMLYVNSANDARLTVSKVAALVKQPVTLRHPDYDPDTCRKLAEATGPPTEGQAASCRDYPLQVAITSRGDLATKRLQPIANRLRSDGSPKLEPLALEDAYADPLPSEGTYTHSAAAHMPFLQSHVVDERMCPALSAGRERALRPTCDPGDAECRFAFRTRGERPTCFQVSQRRATGERPPFNRTAFWIMDVDPIVMKDHGDIWNPSFVEMLGQLIAPRGFFEPVGQQGGRRLRLRAEPPQGR